MDIIVLRHAEKLLGANSDPILSPHGLEQAECLSEILTLPRWGRPQKLFASPKRRTQQTLEPLSKKLDIPIEILPDLDEKRSGETHSDFRNRISQMIDLFGGSTQISRKREAATASVVWCSHLDWIEEFRSLVDCEEDLLRDPYDHWSPGQFLVLRPIDLWKVISFGKAP